MLRFQEVVEIVDKSHKFCGRVGRVVPSVNHPQAIIPPVGSVWVELAGDEWPDTFCGIYREEQLRVVGGSIEMWEALAAKNEWSFWDNTYEVLEIDDDGYEWSRPRDGMPCPLDGELMAVFDGQIDQDRMGNDIYGLGWCCVCGFEDIHEVD